MKKNLQEKSQKLEIQTKKAGLTAVQKTALPKAKNSSTKIKKPIVKDVDSPINPNLQKIKTKNETLKPVNTNPSPATTENISQNKNQKEKSTIQTKEGHKQVTDSQKLKEDLEQVALTPEEIEEDFEQVELTPKEIEEDFEQVELTPKKIEEDFEQIELTPKEIEENFEQIELTPEESRKNSIEIEKQKTSKNLPTTSTISEKNTKAKKESSSSTNQIKKFSNLKQKLGNTSLFYPDFARRAKMQGTVSVLFFVTKQGLVEQIQLESSSGHSKLDNFVLQTMARYEFFPNQESWVRHKIPFVLKGEEVERLKLRRE